MPGIGESYETTNPLYQGLRCFPIPRFPSHIVHYTPLADGIVVIRILHGARDVDRILAQQDIPEGE